MIKERITDLCAYDFKSLFKRKGYVWFEEGYYNLNLLAIRTENPNKDFNLFNDVFVINYKTKRGNCTRVFNCTTTPGIKSIKDPQNAKGCAILVPNQYRQTWTIGKHKNKYRALVQYAPVWVYRDGNKDNKLDMLPDTKDYGMFGINIHKAGNLSKLVDNWSAGCIVFQKEQDFNEFMRLVDEQVDNGHGNKFTFTLLDEKDLEKH
jgi:hypothetical protein